MRLTGSHQQSTQNTFGPTPCAHNAISALRTPSKLYEFFVWFFTCCVITLVFVCCFFFYTGVLVFSNMDLLLWDITWSARLISREPFSFHQDINSPFFLFTFLPFVYFSFLIQLRNTTPFLCNFIIAQENKIKQTNKQHVNSFIIVYWWIRLARGLGDSAIQKPQPALLFLPCDHRIVVGTTRRYRLGQAKSVHGQVPHRLARRCAW